MKKIIKENWKFLLIVLLSGLIGGYCLGIYSYDTLSSELLQQLQEENVTKEMVGLSTMFQYGILFGVVLASIGILISKKINLWKKFNLDKKGVITTIIITIIGALILFPGDKLIFGSLNSWVLEQYITKPTIYKIIGGLLVGGVIEEVMMRLFFMSLLVFIMKKIFCKNKTEIPTTIFVIANVISALLFAAGHLPSTAAMTVITPLIVIRCFLFNGGLGLAFGYLYRKYNLGYACVSHGLSHLIADVLMLIFV